MAKKRLPARKGLPARVSKLLGELDKRLFPSGDSRSPAPGFRPLSSGQVFLMIDCSSSMGGNKIEQAKTGALQFSEDAFRRGYRIGLITFAGQADLAMDTRRDRRSLLKAVERLRAAGTTNMAAGLSMARSKLRRRASRARAVVVVTDGYPDDRDAALREARRLRRDGVRIITIGTDGADLGFLSRLSSHESLASYVPADQLSSTMKSASRLLPRTTEDS